MFPQIIRLAVTLYVRFLLSLRNVEDPLHERGIDVSWSPSRKIGPLFAAEIRRKRTSTMRSGSTSRLLKKSTLDAVSGT